MCLQNEGDVASTLNILNVLDELLSAGELISAFNQHQLYSMWCGRRQHEIKAESSVLMDSLRHYNNNKMGHSNWNSQFILLYNIICFVSTLSLLVSVQVQIVVSTIWLVKVAARPCCLCWSTLASVSVPITLSCCHCCTCWLKLDAEVRNDQK